jgi:N-acetyl-gamma-glutamyl-phosphate reductase
MKKSVAVIGASGYAGNEAVRLLSRHSDAELVAGTSNSYEGQAFSTLMDEAPDMKFVAIDSDEVESAEVIFSCLPHKTGMGQVKKWFESGKTVFDLSADYRFTDIGVYEEWYGIKHIADGEFIKQNVVYGLPEVYGDRIKKADLIAVPGCYPTASILALLPALLEKLIEADIAISAVSGTSGAGRGFDTLGVKGGLYAYGFPRHRHTPEIEQALNDVSPETGAVNFVPHIGDFFRGIFATVFTTLKSKGKVGNKIINIYEEFYKDSRFVDVVREIPKLGDVQNSNMCLICPVVDERTNTLVVFSVIDNLGKGAAGQAVQCFNLRFGFDEAEGLV